MIKRSNLFLQDSCIKGAGTGLFTAVDIKKGLQIIEYTGRITTWEQVQKARIFNPYIMYINKNHVIDARPYKRSWARFANDARGLQRVKGLSNNCKFYTYGTRVFLESIKNIAAGSELLVGYGKDYWDVIKENMLITGAKITE